MSRQSSISGFLSSTADQESDSSSLCDPGSDVEMDTAVSEPSVIAFLLG